MWKKFWKSSIGLGDIASWNVLMFLKIVTKWREIQKLKLNNSPTDWVFEKNFSHLFLSRHVLSKLFICFAITWNFNFAANLVTSFSRQKPLNFLEYRVLPSCQVWAQTNKKCKSSYYLAAFCMCPGPAWLDGIIGSLIQTSLWRVCDSRPGTADIQAAISYILIQK